MVKKNVVQWLESANSLKCVGTMEKGISEAWGRERGIKDIPGTWLTGPYANFHFREDEARLKYITILLIWDYPFL